MPLPGEQVPGEVVQQNPVFDEPIHQDQEQHLNLNEPLQQKKGFLDDYVEIEKTGFSDQKEQQEQIEIPELKMYNQRSEFLANPEQMQELNKLKNYMQTRSTENWAQNHDKYAGLYNKLNGKYYKKFKKLFDKQEKTQQQDLIKNADWRSIENQAKKTLAAVQKKDQEQKKIRSQTSIRAFEAEIDELLKDRGFFPSPIYQKVLETAEKYRNEKDLNKQWELLFSLQTRVREYASIRHKKIYGSIKGRRRMNRMTKLLAMMDKLLTDQTIIKNAYKHEERVGQIVRDANSIFADDFKRIAEVNTERKFNIRSSRWQQLLLPYERDDKGNVTPETKENYEINVELIRALQTKDKERRLAAIGRIFLKQNHGEINENSFTEENLPKHLEQIRNGQSVITNHLILMDLVKRENEVYWNKNNNFLTYMTGRENDETRTMLTSAADMYLKKVGYNEQIEGIRMSDPSEKFSKEKEEKRVQSFDNQVKSCLNLAQQLYENRKFTNKDEQLEQKLRDFINDENTKLEKSEENKKEYKENYDYDSPEYLQKTANLMNEKNRQRNMVYDDLKKNHSNLIKNKTYWQLTERLPDMLRPYEKDRNGQPTEGTKAIYEQNEKMLTLLYSENPEERIAAIAFVYLRNKKITIEKSNELDDGKLNILMRAQATTEGFPTQYNTICDFVKDEKKRQPENQFILYMDKQLSSIEFAYEIPAAEAHYRAMGYDENMQSEGQKQVQKTIKEGMLAGLEEGIQKEKKDNGGKLVKVNPTIERQLMDLCRKKGLK